MALHQTWEIAIKVKQPLSQQQTPTAMEVHRGFFPVIGKVLRIIVAHGFGVVISSLCPPRPKTYSWTAAFVLRASFAVGKAGVGA